MNSFLQLEVPTKHVVDSRVNSSEIHRKNVPPPEPFTKIFSLEGIPFSNQEVLFSANQVGLCILLAFCYIFSGDDMSSFQLKKRRF
jgi:hypothetical protein